MGMKSKLAPVRGVRRGERRRGDAFLATRVGNPVAPTRTITGAITGAMMRRPEPRALRRALAYLGAVQHDGSGSPRSERPYRELAEWRCARLDERSVPRGKKPLSLVARRGRASGTARPGASSTTSRNAPRATLLRPGPCFFA